MKIKLTPSEMMTAAMVGVMRQIQNLKRKRRDAHGFQGPAWQIHIEGAMGECAVAKALGLYWSGAVGNLKAADVGEIEVRTTGYESGKLIVRNSDPDESIFVLVIGMNGSYRLAGWLYGEKAKRPRYKDKVGNRDVAYFVPQKELTKMDWLFHPTNTQK